MRLLLALAAADAPLSWDAAYAAAGPLVAQMTADEQASLMRGVGWTGGVLDKWWYVGNVPGIPRLGLPPLKMQDAAGGFRTYWTEMVGTVTCWPSLLALAATWDPDMVGQFAEALGAEFKGKGANVILGPSLNVHRVARNGRNFEYLSGEDPYLGAQLAAAYVTGVQSQGVMAVMKHFVFNSQETNRTTESSVVDDKTAFELYYPPFEAAVQAGASGAMCSYNAADGVFACENADRLSRDLKGALGFRGFVQSDWGATHSTAADRGMDMEMPMAKDVNASADYWYAPELLAQQATARNASALRIVAAMLRMGLRGQQTCAPPCQADLMANVTSAAHSDLAADLATESVVLLQNDGVLPLGPGVKTLAVLGSASDSPSFDPTSDQGHGTWNTGDFYSGGGSGHVTALHPVTALQGLSRRAAAAGVAVVAEPSDDVAAGVQAAAKADAAVVVCGATSGEALDRPDLRLNASCEALIAAVSNETKTIVLLQVPGAVLTPWRSRAAALLALFLGGERTGDAWARVLFGDHAPTGKLPLQFPESEADTIAPDPRPQVVYSEGLATSYRNPRVTPAFDFGHGLTYTRFTFGAFRASPCASALCVNGTVANTGAVAAKAVAQLYARFPPEAGQPGPVLKGFVKTPRVAPGVSQPVAFALTERDLRYFAGGWRRCAALDLLIGASRRDVRQELHVALHQVWV